MAASCAITSGREPGERNSDASKSRSQPPRHRTCLGEVLTVLVVSFPRQVSRAIRVPSWGGPAEARAVTGVHRPTWVYRSHPIAMVMWWTGLDV